MRSLTQLTVVMILVGGLFIVPASASAQEASPSAELVPPNARECQIEPRSDEEIAALSATGATPVGFAEGVVAVDDDGPISLPEGSPIDGATRAGIEQTLREVVACAQAGDLSRLLALYSDAAVQRLVLQAEPVPIVPGQPESGSSFLSASPVASADRTPIVGDARLLPDGRVAAVVSGVAPGSRSEVVTFVQGESQTTDRWLIDEIRPLLTDEETPTAGGEMDNPVVAAILAEASSRLGVPIDQIEIVSIDAQEWSDSALGCPVDGEMYAQVITPGFQIIVEGAGQLLDYRTDSDGNFKVCEA